MSQFCHLHLHTHFSLLDGLTRPARLMPRIKELGMDSVAITDHGNMFGAIEFYKEAKAAGVKPIIGCEMYICNDASKKTLVDNNIHHLTLLAMNMDGYKNLIKLVSWANINGFYYKPRIDFGILSQHSDGLICMSGCLGGELSQLMLKDDKKAVVDTVNKYKQLFGDRYYIELQAHPNNSDQVKITPRLIKLARFTNTPVVATGDAHYIHKEEKNDHETLLAINTGSSLEDKNRFSTSDSDIYVASPEEMIAKFKDTPDAIENTNIIAERCNLEIELDKIKLPTFDVPNGYTVDSYLSKLAHDGLQSRGLADNKDYVERLTYELDIIQKTGFGAYLLIVWDMIRWAKEHSIAVGPGRGSAAGSLICYCLNITNVDPIHYGLLFERFMNPQRVSMPDIDMDFDDTRRKDVIEYVTTKYGKNHVAQIVTFGTMFARSSIRDAGRAMGYDIATCDRIAKMIPFMQSISSTLEDSTELKREYQDPNSRRLIDMAGKLEGVVRHAGVHACGVLIADKEITEYAPVMLSKDGGVTSEYDMDSVASLGLLKMDFLGLRNLSVMSETTKLIKRDFGFDLDINNIPLDDQNTFKLLQMGKTTSVFQLESNGMKRYLRGLLPTSIDDITAMVSLYRPGPMELLPEYIARKHGKHNVEFLDPLLEPVLKDTYGIMVYQEQLIKAVQVLAGFSLAEADVLRKAVGKKNKQLLDEQEGKFKLGCERNGISKSIADKFWSLVEPFNRYAFNKSHAVCYALIAYQTAYLKANYPLQFMVAELNSSKDIERIKEVVAELKDMGINVLPPHINNSDAIFTNNKNNIHFGLSAIKGMNSKVIDEILSLRQSGGPFVSLEDFITRVGKLLNKNVVSLLARSGSIDDWGNRADIDAMADIIAIYSKNTISEVAPKLVLDKIAPPTIGRRLAWEKDILGVYISDNPARNHYNAIKQYNTVDIVDMAKHVGQRCRIGGVISDFQKKISKNKKTTYTIRLQDTTGDTEIMLFGSVYDKNASLFKRDNVVVLFGDIKPRDGIPTFTCLAGNKIAQLA